MRLTDFRVSSKGTWMRHGSHFSLLSLLFSFIVVLASASPQAASVPEAVAQQHLLPHAAPVYPAIARAAHVEGEVKLNIAVDAKGVVISEKVISGPPMLRQAAVDAVKQWKFAPFLVEDSASQAEFPLTVPFRLEHSEGEPSPAQLTAAQAWFPLSDKCRNSLKDKDAQASMDQCKQALEAAMAAGEIGSSNQLALIESHESYGRALLAGGKLDDALVEERTAVQAAQAHLKDTDQEYAMPFYWRALVEARLGLSDAASADLTVAEETHRRAIVQLPEMKGMYSRYLASILRQHSALLRRMGKQDEAGKLEQEASSL